MPEKGTGRLAQIIRKLRALEEAIRSMTPSHAPGLRTSQTAIGTSRTLELRPSKKGGDGKVSKMRVLAIGQDSWSCKNIETSEEVGVAKPWTLRYSPFHGKTIRFQDEDDVIYTATYDYVTSIKRRVTIAFAGGAEGLTETQVINPRITIIDPTYVDYIWAAKSEDTGVSGVEWVDINADGRAWARAR